MWAGAGKRACPIRTAVTCNRPTLQHGHTDTSMRATRAMNARAHSMACGLDAGICKADKKGPGGPFLWQEYAPINMKISGKTHVIVPTAVSPPVEVAHPEDSRQVQTKRLGFMAG